MSFSPSIVVAYAWIPIIPATPRHFSNALISPYSVLRVTSASLLLVVLGSTLTAMLLTLLTVPKLPVPSSPYEPRKPSSLLVKAVMLCRENTR